MKHQRLLIGVIIIAFTGFFSVIADAQPSWLWGEKHSAQYPGHKSEKEEPAQKNYPSGNERLPTPAAGNNIIVKTILASQGEKYIDPALTTLINEFQTVFRYSSYRLLNQSAMKLNVGQTGTTVLPGGRFLRVTPINIAGNRASLRLEILKDNRQIFQTEVQLLNKGSITVGGPQHEGGYLLFNITNSF